MRKHYRCKQCGIELDSFGDYPLYYCPLCMNKSDSTSVEYWADISHFTFDQDIQTSLDDGSFLKALKLEID